MRTFLPFFIISVLTSGFVMFNSQIASAGIPDLPCELIIEKVEVPDTGQEFDFSLTGDVNGEFSLSNGESVGRVFDIDDVVELREDIPDGYTLDIQCTEGVTNCGVGVFVPCLSLTPLPDGTGVTIECMDDDTGSCTFTNVQDTTRNVPTISEWGLIAMASILGIVGFMVLRRRKVTA